LLTLHQAGTCPDKNICIGTITSKNHHAIKVGYGEAMDLFEKIGLIFMLSSWEAKK